MSIKPILFNTEMVRAILNGRKTVTRRIIKPQPEMQLCYISMGSHNVGKWTYPSENTWRWWGEEWKLPASISDEEKARLWSPPCRGDDILWVRETWAMHGNPNAGRPMHYCYRADMQDPQYFENGFFAEWRPSIHMPKEAARLFLKVKNVNVERLQDITMKQLDQEGSIPSCRMCHFNEQISEHGMKCSKGIEKAAFVIDVRGGVLFDDLKGALEDLKKAGVDYKILYFEASEKVLARRYNETRRAHPLAEGGSVLSGIRKEKKMLQSLRDASDFVIDTSDMKAAQLSAYISELVATEKDKRGFIINIMSFGYKNGMPISADMVFDARFIPNPFYVKSLKNLTGNNKKVSQFVLKHDITQHFLDKIEDMIIQLIPYYMNEGKYSLSVCFGCTGGHHRSVALANELNRRLTERGKRTTLEHRDL